MKDAVSGMKSDIELLEQLSKELVPEDLIEQDQESAVGDFAECNTATGWPEIPLPSIMPQLQGIVRWPLGLGPPIVAGTMIGLVMAPEAPLRGGLRGQDSRKRSKRQCQRCLANNGGDVEKCNGRMGGKCYRSKACQYFSNS